MLPICLDEATKIAGDILAGKKCYPLQRRSGKRTATGMRKARCLRAAVPALSEQAIRQCSPGLSGANPRFRRCIPRSSRAASRSTASRAPAKWSSGQRARSTSRALRFCPLRRRRFVSRRSVRRHLCTNPREDVARALGTCGYVTSLRRLYVEPFVSAPMHSLDSIAELRAAGRWPEVMAADLAISHLAAVHLDAAASVRLMHGQAVDRCARSGARVRLYDDSGRFLGMGERDAEVLCVRGGCLSCSRTATRVEFRGCNGPKIKFQD